MLPRCSGYVPKRHPSQPIPVPSGLGVSVSSLATLEPSHYRQDGRMRALYLLSGSPGARRDRRIARAPLGGSFRLDYCPRIPPLTPILVWLVGKKIPQVAAQSADRHTGTVRFSLIRRVLAHDSRRCCFGRTPHAALSPFSWYQEPSFLFFGGSEPAPSG
jgi:hypothetical protein